MVANDQLVVFGLNNQRYALPINNVSEIIRMMEVTKVPNIRYYYKGIINLRGSIVPVMNLNLRLGLEESELGGDSRIIVTEQDGRKLGLIVDTVYSVSRYSGDEVEKPESVSDGGQFVTGIVHHEDGMILLLNLHGIMD